jgi:hypothetical protein
MCLDNWNPVTLNHLKISSIIMAGSVMFVVGCSQSKIATWGQPLSPLAASQLAAQLANDECIKHQWREVFSASQYSAVLIDGTYHWGGLNLFAHEGVSALVTFRQDGSAPHVDLYYSESVVRCKLIHLNSPHEPKQTLIYR